MTALLEYLTALSEYFAFILSCLGQVKTHLPKQYPDTFRNPLLVSQKCQISEFVWISKAHSLAYMYILISYSNRSCTWSQNTNRTVSSTVRTIKGLDNPLIVFKR